jgi:hypothetical protein
MKLRQALKICRERFDPIIQDGRRAGRLRGICFGRKGDTVLRAIMFGRRKRADGRFPHIPSEDERLEIYGLANSLLADVVIEDESAREAYKERLWAGIGRIMSID